MITTNSFEPNYATPPGWVLEEVLEERSMSQADLARRSDLSTKLISQILRGEAPITVESAVRLEPATGISARIWSNMERGYREDLLRLKEDAALEKQVGFLDQFPIAAMVSQGLLTKRLPRVKRLRELLSFFGVSSPEAWEAVWSPQLKTAAFRKSSGSDTGALTVWLRLGELEALKSSPDSWDAAKFKASLRYLRTLTKESDSRKWYQALVKECAKAGVILVVVPEVKGAKANGASRWLGKDRPLIQLSLRHRRSDVFWFSFFHEACHILDEIRKPIFVNYEESERDEEERRADSFSSDLLIPPEHKHELQQLHTYEAVHSFARKIGIHTGIVVGRLQHEALWAHNKGNDLKQNLNFADS